MKIKNNKTKIFNLEELYKIINSRIKSKNKNSYTYMLDKSPKMLYKKIREEAIELTKTRNKKQVIWETADLLYFVTVLLAKRKVKFEEVYKKLEERNKNPRKLIKLNKRGK